MKTDVTPLKESRSLAVRRLKALKRSLRARSQFDEFTVSMWEYFDMGYAEPVPASELERPCKEVYYLSMHGVRKESSKTSKVRVVFDAFAKSSSGTSLNDQLLVGPYGPLIPSARLITVSTSQSLTNNRCHSNVSRGPPP